MKYDNSKAKSASKAGMSGKDNFTEHRTAKKSDMAKPKGYGGTKNNTDIRPQSK